MKEKYITRYEADKGQSYTFLGWRLCITRRGERFVKYFSDLKYGSADSSLAAAVQMRDAMIQTMEKGVVDYKSFFNEYRRMGSVVKID